MSGMVEPLSGTFLEESFASPATKVLPPLVLKGFPEAEPPRTSQFVRPTPAEALLPAAEALLPAAEAPLPAAEAPLPAAEAPLPAAEAPLPVSGSRRAMSDEDLTPRHTVQTLQSMVSSGTAEPAGAGAATAFRELLRLLEAEHARALAELQDEVSRLRSCHCNGAYQEENHPTSRSLAQMSEAASETSSRRSPSPVRRAPSNADLQALETAAALSDGCLARVRRDRSPARQVLGGPSSSSGHNMEPQMFPLVPLEERDPTSTRSLDFSPTDPHLRHQASGEDARSLLKVTIVDASGLRCTDWMKGSVDPYCICHISGRAEPEFQTHVVDDVHNPAWNYEAVIDNYRPGDSLEFTVKAQDWLQSDQVLGSITLPASSFCDRGFEGEVPLTTPHPEETRGFLRIKVEHRSKREVHRVRDIWLRQRRLSSDSLVPANKRALNYVATMAVSAEELSRKPETSKRKRSWCCCAMFDPSCGRRLAWDTFGILFVGWDIIWLPLQVFQPVQDGPILFLGTLILLYWTLDIFVTFNTGTYKKGGFLVMDRKMVAWTYLRRWFFPDLLIVAVEWALILDSGSEGAGAARAGRLARVGRSIRLLRLMRMAKLRELLFSLQSLINSEWMSVVFILGKNLLTIVFLNHVLACFWFLIGCSSEEGWVQQAGLAGNDVWTQYFVSLQWSMAQFTPGAAPVTAGTLGERSFTVAVLTISLITATCFVSTITSTVSSVWAMQRNESVQAFLLKKFLRQNNISRSLGSRVTRYIDCVIELRQQKVHPTRVQYLSLLSGPLHVELLSELREPQVFVHKLFPRYKEASVCAFREICTTALQQNNFAKNDMLFHRKTEAKYMYFLNSGTLVYRRILSDKGSQEQQKSKVEAGQWCSENALWMPWQHAGDMKAVSDVDVTLLNAARFCEVSNSDPEAHQLAASYCMRFMERIHQASSFDTKAITDLPLIVHIIGVDGAEGPKQVRRRGGNDMSLTPAAQFVREAEDMEAELIAFPDPEPKEAAAHTAEKVEAKASSRRHAEPRRSLAALSLAQRCLTPRLRRARTRTAPSPAPTPPPTASGT